MEKKPHLTNLDGTFLNSEPQISEELQGWIQPLSEEQFQQLKENIEQEGVRDPLMVWKEKDLLVDGHLSLIHI